jgi:membrane protein YqaA with SNARE-associated domain
MDAILQFLIDWGYWGLFLGSFIAGSVLPFSSEAVLAACVGPLGLDPVISITAATAGNVAGGMTCYWMGHLGNMEWIEKYFHVKKEKMDRAERFVHGRGAWMGEVYSTLSFSSDWEACCFHSCFTLYLCSIWG